MEKIEIPSGMEATVNDRKIIVKGPKGTLEKDFDDPRFNDLIDIRIESGSLLIEEKEEGRKARAMAGAMKAHVANMLTGAKSGYKYTLRIIYTHFPMTVTVEKNEVHIKNFLGEKGARVAKIHGSAEVKADKETVTVTGTSLEDVGQTAANIDAACKLRGRDRRIFQDGIYLDTKQLQTGETI